MPLYDFECPRCANKIEKLQGMNDGNPDCEVCGGKMVKLPSRPMMIRVLHKGGAPVRSKGYKKDYAKDYRKRLHPETR